MKSPLILFAAFFLIGFNAQAEEKPVNTVVAGTYAADPELDEILSLDISQLTVTSVSKRAQKLTDAPAAIYVVTQEDIHRSGATTIPEALRMVPGLDVAQVSSHSWAVSSRGFNNALANKLLVLIDGRTIYTPVFSGTYWDDQGTLLEDIDRIEVIRGPGASLWGANAVNGIINIITKSAANTQGNYASTGLGTDEKFAEARHGGKYGDDGYYRVYGQYSHYGATDSIIDEATPDNWWRARSGFRVDTQPSSQDSYTVEGDAYGGRQWSQSRVPFPTAPFTRTVDSLDDSYGANVLGRWNRQLTNDSSMSLQGYVDHYSRLEDIAYQEVSTADIELQNNMKLNDRNNFVWGSGARFVMEDIKGTFVARVNDEVANHYILNAFLQDEYAITPDILYLTLGSKFEYNDFTGPEVEPSARLAWHPTTNQTVWTAVSRAVRVPSSIEEDVSVAAQVTAGSPPSALRLIGNDDQESEELIAYELGHRIQPTKNVSFDSTVFLNDYSKLATVSVAGVPFDGGDGTEVTPFTVNNLGRGRVWGAEEAANWNVTGDWRLMGSYTLLKMDLDVDPGAGATLKSTQRASPHNQFSIRSYWNITDKTQWDNMFYYVGNIRGAPESYLRYDTRLAWEVSPGVEASLIGRNLLDPDHAEFPVTLQTDIQRSILARVSWRF